MNHKFYYRILTLFAIGICMCLRPSTSYGQTSSQGNQGWECDACNDNNPCTFDFCFYGYCFNLPLRNCGQERVCDLKVIYAKTTNCYYDAVERKSKATLKVCVWWRDADPRKDLKVYISGQSKTIDIRNASGDACVEFTVDANGTQNNRVWTEFVGNTECKAEKKYNIPASCTPSCDLEITNVSIDDCYFDQRDSKSKAELTVCVEWDDRPNNENIVVALANQQKLVKPEVGIKEGNKCVKFIIPADGTQNNVISAAFQTTATCNDTYKYTAPRPCFQAPPCDIDITHVSVGDCYFDNASSKSKADLTICVQWQNRPNNDNIMVSVVGQAVNIVPNSSTGISRGNKCIKFTIPADGTNYNGIWAKFINHGTCQDEAYYKAPSNCQPAPTCNVNIKSVSVGSCYFDAYDSKSRAELTICVEWKNRPNNENIYVSINDQYQVIYPTITSGIKCVKFNVLANGTQNNGIWAKFQYTPCQDDDKYNAPAPCLPQPVCDIQITSATVGACYYTPCQDDDKYNAPAPCLPQPVCDIQITSATVGACYFDPADNKSKAELTVCVAWKTPVNQNIVVAINSQPAQIINTGGVDGSQCVKFIIPANGPANDGIWAYFQQTTSCTADAFYTIPAPCLPLPVCNVNITSATIGACYFDPADNTSKAELEVCVQWSNRPGTENIVVVIDGPPKQMKLITTTDASGSACVKFIIPANGVYNAGVWVYFQNTTSCGADISYTVPAPCLPLPVCNVNITSATIGACYFDPADNTSKAELEVCVQWSNRPGTENIVVVIDGPPKQMKLITTTDASGSACVKFIIPANGVYNAGVWVYFQNTTSCGADISYTVPAPCLPLPVCNVNITSVTVGQCYFDQNDNKSKAELTVCVEWKDRPGTENIYVSISGYYQVINTNVTNINGSNSGTGNKCVKFIIPANGSSNNNILARFQYSTICQDESKYHAPNSCNQAPVCDLNITSVSVSNCYYDPAALRSKAELTVCLSWKNRPNNERIFITISGQKGMITPSLSTGNGCVKFTVPANATTNNNIWAMFEFTASCQDEAYYNCPLPCTYTPPSCALKITKTEVGNCYYDHADNKSKAKLKICLQWDAAPANEKIILKVGNTTNYIYSNARSGGICLEYTVLANGAQNIEVWAKFESTYSCFQKKYFNVPYACNTGNRVAESTNKPAEANVQALDLDKIESTSEVAVEDATEETATYNLATTSTTATHDLRVFPNPTSEELSVDLTSFAGKKVHLQVFNTVGQVMYQTTIDEVITDKVQLDVRKYTNDMYFLKVNVLNEGTYTQKFVVKR